VWSSRLLLSAHSSSSRDTLEALEKPNKLGRLNLFPCNCKLLQMGERSSCASKYHCRGETGQHWAVIETLSQAIGNATEAECPML